MMFKPLETIKEYEKRQKKLTTDKFPQETALLAEIYELVEDEAPTDIFASSSQNELPLKT